MRITILGCGGSAGVPAIGGDWGACDPANPKNHRSRASIYIQSGQGQSGQSRSGQGGTGLLIDTSPDLRRQLLDNDIRRIDGVLWTHNHADHCHGLDDLREVCRINACPLDVFAAPEHLADIVRRFDYCFEPLPHAWMVYRPVLNAHVIDVAAGAFSAAGMRITPFLQDHGYMKTLGYRIGKFAYSTDVVKLDEVAFAALAGVEVWVVDCQREGPEHPVHAHLPLTLSWIERVAPKRAILTHMNQSMDYETIRRKLPSGVEPGYDGLVIDMAD